MATPAAAARGGTAPATPKATSAVAPAAPPKKEMDDATAQALAEAKARAASRAAAGVGAVQRLGRQLEHLRGAGSVAARPPTVSIPASVPVTAPANAGGNAASGDPEYAKAHLKEILMRRRQVSRPEPTGRTVADKPRDPVQDLKTAQDLLREKHFGKAEELLRAVVEANPQNEMARLFWVWSKVRSAQEPDGKDLEELRDGARKLVQNEEHGAFACYVLGHLAFVAKKDDVAEKFFRKAFARDKTMKDAERHILILERRKQVLANAEAQNNVKLFGITIKKG
jgi:hypothetical protein